jgi:hypothetical protein
MLTFNQYLKESAADFDPALKNFQSQVLGSSGYYTSLNNLKSSKLVSGKEAEQMVRDDFGDHFDRMFPNPSQSFDDSKFAFVLFMGSGAHASLLVSVDKHNGDLKMGKDYFHGNDNNIFKAFRWEQVKNEKTFKNATVYLTGGMGNIIRVDCREIKIQVGKYAQYDKAISVKYLQKGKQKWQGVWATYDPLVVVVPTDKAIQPDDMFGDAELSSTPGVTVKKSRYSSFDPRWKSDFLAQLKAMHVPVLWSHEQAK